MARPIKLEEERKVKFGISLDRVLFDRMVKEKVKKSTLLNKLLKEYYEKKICSRCKEEKEFCEFGVCNSSKEGLKSSCKVCRKIEGKIYRENNAEKRKETIKNWKNKNPEYNRNYYINNIELVNKRNKKWYENNKEKHRENR